MNVATVNRADILKALGIIKEIIKPDTTENTDPSKYVIIQHGRIHCISNQFMLVIPSELNFDARCIDVEFALLQLVDFLVHKFLHVLGVPVGRDVCVPGLDEAAPYYVRAPSAPHVIAVVQGMYHGDYQASRLLPGRVRGDREGVVPQLPGLERLRHAVCVSVRED